jgi:hypothetical protein
MNDVAKTNIQNKLLSALEKENLSNVEAGRILGVMPNYISMIKNSNTWDKASVAAWEAVQKWVNSGQRLAEYGERHGKCLPDKMKVDVNDDLAGMRKSANKDNERFFQPGQTQTWTAPVIDVYDAEKNEKYPDITKNPIKELKEMIAKLEAENTRLAELNNSMVPAELQKHPTQVQKIVVDFELNLTVNGKKICLA